MMLLNYCLLALSVSIDSFGIGITYGLRKTKIIPVAKIILFLISFIMASISLYLGNFISRFLPAIFTKWIGCTLLVSMGIWIIYQAIYSTNSNESAKKTISKKYQIFLKPLGITIQIIRNPITSDLDNSHKIDAKEALYLGFALSIDSICVGLGSSLMGISSLLFPTLVAIFQLVFLSLGATFSKKIITSFSVPENIGSILSGSLLLLIGFSRFFF